MCRASYPFQEKFENNLKGIGKQPSRVNQSISVLVPYGPLDTKQFVFLPVTVNASIRIVIPQLL